MSLDLNLKETLKTYKEKLIDLFKPKSLEIKCIEIQPNSIGDDYITFNYMLSDNSWSIPFALNVGDEFIEIPVNYDGCVYCGAGDGQLQNMYVFDSMFPAGTKIIQIDSRSLGTGEWIEYKLTFDKSRIRAIQPCTKYAFVFGDIQYLEKHFYEYYTHNDWISKSSTSDFADLIEGSDNNAVIPFDSRLVNSKIITIAGFVIKVPANTSHLEVRFFAQNSKYQAPSFLKIFAVSPEEGTFDNGKLMTFSFKGGGFFVSPKDYESLHTYVNSDWNYSNVLKPVEDIMPDGRFSSSFYSKDYGFYESNSSSSAHGLNHQDWYRCKGKMVYYGGVWFNDSYLGASY